MSDTLLRVEHLTTAFHTDRGTLRAVDDVSSALRAAIQRVRSITDVGAEQRASLTLMVTDGDTMVATRGGKELYWSSYKARCSDRASCPSLSAECEAPSRTGFVNHFILSSEPLQGENVWQELEEGEVIGVDWRMRVTRSHIDRVPLPIAASP